MFLQAVFLGVCLFGCTIAIKIPMEEPPPPGIIIRLTTSALNFGCDYGAKHFLADYIRMSLNGRKRTESCPFGNCSLQNFYIRSYIPPVSKVTVRRGEGIDCKLVGAELTLLFDFEFNGTDVDEKRYVKGNAVVQLYGISLAAVLNVSGGIDEKLDISMSKCSADVRVIYCDVTITHKDGNSETSDDLLSRKIQDYLQVRANESVSTVMCNMAHSVARMIPDGLRQMNEKLASSFGFIVDETLRRELRLEPDCIEAAFSGAVRMVGADVGVSVYPPNRNFSMPESSMVGVYISVFVANSLSYVLFKTEKFSLNITKDLLPANYRKYRSFFDTSCDDTFCFGAICPNISEKYPNTSVTFAIRAQSPLWIDVFYALLFGGPFELCIVIPDVDGSEVTVANLTMYIGIVAGTLTFSDRVVGAVFPTPVRITDNGSSKEFVSYLPRFNNVLQTIVELILLPKINQYGALGFPLYFSNGIRLDNADIDFKRGALLFSTDVVYDSTPSMEKDYAVYSQYLSLFNQKEM